VLQIEKHLVEKLRTTIVIVIQLPLHDRLKLNKKIHVQHLNKTGERRDAIHRVNVCLRRMDIRAVTY